MKNEDLREMPRDVLKRLCDEYDMVVGEYPDPTYVGEDFFKFFEDQMEKLIKEEELIEHLAEIEHYQWIRRSIASSQKR